MKFLDRNDPIFKRAWLRWGCVLLPLGWAVVEFTLQSPGWGVIFAGLGAYAAYELFLRAAD